MEQIRKSIRIGYIIQVAIMLVAIIIRILLALDGVTLQNPWYVPLIGFANFIVCSILVGKSVDKNIEGISKEADELIEKYYLMDNSALWFTFAFSKKSEDTAIVKELKKSMRHVYAISLIAFLQIPFLSIFVF